MGFYGILRNYSHRHDFNLEWKNKFPSIEYVLAIGKILGWNFDSDLIVFEHDDGWDKFVGNKWEFQKDKPIPELDEYMSDLLFSEYRDINGWLTLDLVKLDEMIEKKTFHQYPTTNILFLIVS